MKLEQKNHILFIGDSVTAVDRDPTDTADLGHGYPQIIAKALAERYPKMDLSFSNRGIGGDKLIDMAVRWQEDCLALKPTIVSILIGINDTWHAVNLEQLEDRLELQQFEQHYRSLLESLKFELSCQIVLMEPFVLPNPADHEIWRRNLDPRIQVVRRLVREFQTDFIPLDGLLNDIKIKQKDNCLTREDGVHPTTLGHAIIAKAWLKAIEND